MSQTNLPLSHPPCSPLVPAVTAEIPTPARWQTRACTGCGSELGTGTAVFRLSVTQYAPMQPGPDWECVGDWTDPKPLAGTFCALCLNAVQKLAMDHLCAADGER